MTRILLATLTYLIITSNALAQSNPVLDRIEAFKSAYNAGDGAAVAEFYTKDGALIPPRSSIIVGRAAIAKYYSQAFVNGVGQLSIQVREIRSHSANTAIEISDMTAKISGNAIDGRYLHVWVQVEGNWYLSRDMFHLR